MRIDAPRDHSLKTALKNAKKSDFKFQDLRHTFASRLVMAGVDLTTVSERLRSKDIKMTLRHVRLVPAHKAKAADSLDKTLTGEPTIQSSGQRRRERISVAREILKLKANLSGAEWDRTVDLLNAMYLFSQ